MVQDQSAAASFFRSAVLRRGVGVRSMSSATDPKSDASAATAKNSKRPCGRHPGVTEAGVPTKARRGGNVSEIALEARHLFKVFGKNPSQAVRRLKAGESRTDVADAGTAAVIDAGFTVNKGEIFVIMGLSGSGKSTIIRMLNGLHEATD